MSFVSSKIAHHDLRYSLKMPLSELILRKKRRQRILLLLLLLAAGGTARWLRVTSPIHELCHVITANVVGGGGKLSGWTEATVWAKYGDHKLIRWSGAYGEQIIYLVLFTLLHVWKHRAGGAFWLGTGTVSYFRAHLLADLNTHSTWYGQVGDPETAAALLTFHVIFGVILSVGWILFLGREWVYQTDVLPYLRPEPPRPFLERIRRRWG